MVLDITQPDWITLCRLITVIINLNCRLESKAEFRGGRNRMCLLEVLTWLLFLSWCTDVDTKRESQILTAFLMFRRFDMVSHCINQFSCSDIHKLVNLSHNKQMVMSLIQPALWLLCTGSLEWLSNLHALHHHQTSLGKSSTQILVPPLCSFLVSISQVPDFFSNCMIIDTHWSKRRTIDIKSSKQIAFVHSVCTFFFVTNSHSRPHVVSSRFSVFLHFQLLFSCYCCALQKREKSFPHPLLLGWQAEREAQNFFPSCSLK